MNINEKNLTDRDSFCNVNNIQSMIPEDLKIYNDKTCINDIQLYYSN